MDTQAKIETDRTALYRREARGDVVNPEEWLALGARQTALNAHLFDRHGYMTTIEAAASAAIIETEALMAKIEKAAR